jgi:hypothetical protein
LTGTENSRSVRRTAQRYCCKEAGRHLLSGMSGMPTQAAGAEQIQRCMPRCGVGLGMRAWAWPNQRSLNRCGLGGHGQRLAHHEKCPIVFVDSHARKSNDVGVVDCAKNGSLLQQRPGSTQDLQVTIPSGKMLY